MKNVVIYWCNFRGKKSDLLSFLGSKRKVYLEVFDEISKESNLHLVFGRENYLGGLRFKTYYTYNQGKFERHNGEIEADAVLDRSRGLDFPQQDKVLNKKVLNQYSFKKMVGDKWFFYKNFKKYSPLTFLVSNENDAKVALKKIKTEKVVVKPIDGLKGRDIEIYNKEEVVLPSLKLPLLFQEFVETKGFFGNEFKRHDIRVVVINGKPVYSVVRKPAKDGYLANVAQGGSIEEVALIDLPPQILYIAKKIAKKIKKKYDNPFYSIDFGNTLSGPKIFEMNNFIGFPLIERNHKEFVKNLAKVLVEKTEL